MLQRKVLKEMLTLIAKFYAFLFLFVFRLLELKNSFTDFLPQKTGLTSTTICMGFVFEKGDRGTHFSVLFNSLFLILPFGQSSILPHLSFSKRTAVSLAVAVPRNVVPFYRTIKTAQYYCHTSVYT